MSSIHFADIRVDRLEPEATLPAKFQRLLTDLEKTVTGKTVCIKMHLGGQMGYTTIHPFFVRILVDKLKSFGVKDLFICDGDATNCEMRGYHEKTLGCRIVSLFRDNAPERQIKQIGFKYLDQVEIASEPLQSDILLVFSHVKGHGACGFGGAGKNIAMGMVPHVTRGKLHRLEGGIKWLKDKCNRCKQCINSCPNNANSFTSENEYEIFFHNCTFCQHCILACPRKALLLEDADFANFQRGMALCTQSVLDYFPGDRKYFINVLMNITIFCDCWGLSTPSLVPDIGIVAGRDIVAVEQATLDKIDASRFIPDGMPKGRKLGAGKHLFEQIHGKDPYLMSVIMSELGLGSLKYDLSEVK